MKLREFCECALSNDLIGIVEDIMHETPKEVHAAFRLLENNDDILDREIDRFTYGKCSFLSSREILYVKLK